MFKNVPNSQKAPANRKYVRLVTMSESGIQKLSAAYKNYKYSKLFCSAAKEN